MREETIQLMEDIVLQDLEDLQYEDNKDKRKEKMNEVLSLSEKILEDSRQVFEANDRAQKMQLEAEKIASNEKIEAEKSKIGWKKVVFEFGKIVLPVVLSSLAYNVFQKRVMDFERDGLRMTGQASRDLHLPRI